MVWKIFQKNQVMHVTKKGFKTASLNRALDQLGTASTVSVYSTSRTVNAENETADVYQIEAERKRAMGIMYYKQNVY